MKLILLAASKGPHTTQIERLKRELSQFRVEPEVIDADSRRGSALTELYDAVARPTVLVLRDDGQLIEKWDHLPGALEIMNVYTPA